jgi:DinB superfamily
LADSDLVWGWRLRMILAQLNYADADPDEAMSVFAILRRANLKLIDRATPAELERVGVHSERGEESIEYLLGLYAGHDLLHLRQIERIRASLAR